MGGRGSKASSSTASAEGEHQKSAESSTTPTMNPAEREKILGQTHAQSEAVFIKGFEADKAGWASKLSQEEANGLFDYQGGGYSAMNKYLRKENGTLTSSRPVDITQKEIQNLNAATDALDKASLSEGVVTYRGVKTTMSWENAQKLVGQTQVDYAFGSTTLSPDFAKEWSQKSVVAHGTEEKPYISYRYTMPKGSKAAYVLASTNPGAKKTDYFYKEKELLVQRGARYKITGVSKRVINGKHHIYISATYTGQEPGYNTPIDVSKATI